MHISNVFTSVFVALIILAGCATSDYGRITNKISAYEGQAATERDKLKTANPQSKLAIYQSLMKIYNNQLLIARRINPETNPAYKKAQSRSSNQRRRTLNKSQILRTAWNRPSRRAMSYFANFKCPPRLHRYQLLQHRPRLPRSDHGIALRRLL